MLDWVEAGEEVVITHRGKPVARLVPPSLAFDRERSRNAVQKTRAMRKGVTFGRFKIKDLINEGRRRAWCSALTDIVLDRVSENGPLCRRCGVSKSPMHFNRRSSESG